MLLLLALMACDPTDTDADGIADISDCAPEDASVFPGNPETCDGVDNNCDGVIDEGVTTQVYTDADGDGWGELDSVSEVCELAEDHVTLAGDCDDSDPTLTPETEWFLDSDGDGYGDPGSQIASCTAQDGLVANSDDCDDWDSGSYPDAEEVCDGMDNDCNGQVDDSASDSLTFYTDADGDGYGDATVSACEALTGTVSISGDCDDSNADISPGAEEVCDAIDNDCDGSTDFDGWIPADYASIDLALAEEIDGAHFCLSPGTHSASELVSNGATTLEGEGPESVILDAEDSSFIDAYGDLTLIGLSVEGVYSTDDSNPTIYMERGDLSLAQVEIHDVIAAYDYGNNSALIYCSGPCSLMIEDSSFYDIEMPQTEVTSYATTAKLLHGWGGALVMDQVEIYNITAEGNYFYGMLDFWGSSIDLQDVAIHDVNISVNNSGGRTYAGGLMGLYGSHSAVVEGLQVASVDINFGETYAYTRQTWMGEIIGYVEPAEIRNVEILDNRLQGSGIYGIQGLIFDDWTGTAKLENIVVAGNSVSAPSDYFDGLFGAFASLKQADIVGNDLGDHAYSKGLFVPEYQSSITNSNIAFNSLEAEEVEAQFVTYDSSRAEMTWTAVNFYGNTFSGEVSSVDNDGVQFSLSSLNFDPAYTDISGDYAEDWNLNLSSGSAAIDAGDGLDADGSTADLGSQGGIYGASW
jgi:hypothetical protein